MNTLRISNI